MTKHQFSIPLNQMQIDNKISRFLSGHFIFAGIVFLVTGIMGLFLQHWVLAGINLFISWFLFGTYSGVEIDTDKKQFREYNSWFGVFRIGEWKSLDNYLGITLVSMNQVNRIYSRSNRVNSSSKKEFRIYLVNNATRPTVAIKKCKTREQAQTSMDELAIWLKLPVFSVKK
jgi:hypothetical protein